MDADPDRFIRITRVVELMGIAPRTVWRRVASNDLPPPYHNGRAAVWSESEIRDAMQRIKNRSTK